MTDTTDIAALKRPTRKNYDWSKAVWTDCDHCGEAHTGTVLADDGARICAGCCDAEYYSAWEDLAERAIKLLEAERYRADEYKGKLELEQHHSKTLSGTVDILDGQRDHWMERARKAEADNAALKAKLANPVVLPVVQNIGGDEWYWKDGVIRNIKEAGFTVKE